MIRIYCDGACDNTNKNQENKISSYGFVVLDGEGNEIYKEHGVIAKGELATSNVSEHGAILKALEWVESKGVAGAVSVLSDSQMSIYQHLGKTTVCKKGEKPYGKYYRLARIITDRIKKNNIALDFKWIPREQNEIADKLSKIDQK